MSQNLKNEIPQDKKSKALIRELDETLRESEKKYRTLIDNITVGIFRTRPGPKGSFIEVNTAFVQMLGYENKHELYAKEVVDIYLYPEDREKFSKRLIILGSVRNEELRLKKKDGSPLLASVTARAVKHESGKIIYFDGIVDDITERKKVEDELFLHKTYLEELFNSAPEAIVLHDNNDIIVNVNVEFTRLFGYTRDEAIGQPVNNLLVPDELKDEGLFLSESVTHGRRVEAESHRRHKDGHLIQVSILGAPIIKNGQQIGVYAIYRDISERKNAEEELLVQKAYLERLFNSAPEAIVLHDNNDCIANINEEFTRLFGYSREEAIGKPINELVAPRELADEASMVSRKVISGQRIDMESKRKRKDGTLIDVSILGAPIIYNGKQIADYAIYRDISERKKAEEQLNIQKTYLEELFNSAPEAIVLHDNDDRIVNINNEFTKLFGYSRTEAIGKTINELVAPEFLKDEAAHFSDQVTHGKRVEAESQRKRKDGSLIDVSILGAPIISGGQQMGVYAIYRDITERKKIQEARIRQEEEARMARNIQMNFLPKSDPVLPGYQISGKSIPALNVGGDYYDFIRLDEHRLMLALGDVSGKGLAAALVMANLQATIRGQALFDPDPKYCLERANKLLHQSIDARTFISLFLALLDNRRHILRYANAGQDLPLLFPLHGNPAALQMRGLALGMTGDSTYQSEEISFNPGDLLFIYTDGIPEAMNIREQQFGDERVQEILKKNKSLPAASLLKKIIEAVNNHLNGLNPNDDITMLAIKRNLKK